MSSIFFRATTEGFDLEDAANDCHVGVECLIYNETGTLLARHVMTDFGARVRLHDFEMAVEEASWQQELQVVLSLVEKPV